MLKSNDIIKKVSQDDAKTLYHLIKSIYTSSKNPIGGRWDLSSIQSEIQQGHGFKMERLDRLIAVLFYRDAAGNSVDITFLGVDPKFLRQGIMTRMLGRLENSVIGNRIVVEVHESNSAAISFYTFNGFDRVGGRPHYYRDGGGAILLAKDNLP